MYSKLFWIIIFQSMKLVLLFRGCLKALYVQKQTAKETKGTRRCFSKIFDLMEWGDSNNYERTVLTSQSHSQEPPWPELLKQPHQGTPLARPSRPEPQHNGRNQSTSSPLPSTGSETTTEYNRRQEEKSSILEEKPGKVSSGFCARS